MGTAAHIPLRNRLTPVMATGRGANGLLHREPNLLVPVPQLRLRSKWIDLAALVR
jgi:hypothetical protein